MKSLQIADIPFNPWVPAKGRGMTSLVGITYGRLRVVSAYAYAKKQYYWLCRCECGTWCLVATTYLHRQVKPTRSCGCLCTDKVRQANSTHGDSYSAEYNAYHNAFRRCNTPTGVNNYADYGGRGIEFRFTSYEEFINHIGYRPTPQHSLDRINNDGHYEIGNVRWATKPEQDRNRRGCHFLTFNNDTLTIAEWAEKTGIPRSTIDKRIHYGWEISRILTTPRRDYPTKIIANR